MDISGISRPRRAGPALALWLLSAPAWSAGLDLTVEIPRLAVAEYHRPYVAVWLEGADAGGPATLAVWYQKDDWLKDMRRWWRRSGRHLSLPVDGVTGATRPPGTHRLRFGSESAALERLAPGRYQLLVEATREVGGREVLSLPLDWPPAQGHTVTAQGERELGAVRLELQP